MVEQVAKLREEAAMLKLFTDHVKGEEMYGLTLHAVLRITESVRPLPTPLPPLSNFSHQISCA